MYEILFVFGLRNGLDGPNEKNKVLLIPHEFKMQNCPEVCHKFKAAMNILCYKLYSSFFLLVGDGHSFFHPPFFNKIGIFLKTHFQQFS
jgi:hypothetical protein